MSEQVTKLNISQAARAANISRNTLYKKLKRGAISKEQDAEGNPVIDVSELLRVYPKLDMDAALDTEEDTAHKSEPVTTQDTIGAALLELEIKHLNEKLQAEQERRRDAEEREQRLLEIVETQSRMLPAPAEAKPEPELPRRKFLGIF